MSEMCECDAEVRPCTEPQDGNGVLCEACRDHCRYWLDGLDDAQSGTDSPSTKGLK